MPIEFPDLESALARASAGLRAPNQKLLELARSQPEVIGKAKDISPGISELTCQALCGTNVTCLLGRIRHEARLIELLGESLFYRYHARVRELQFRLPRAGVDTTLESAPLKTFSVGLHKRTSRAAW